MLKEMVQRVAAEVIEQGTELPIIVEDTMIDSRAALISRTSSARCKVSFGTNDLTQMTFGYSRDDAVCIFLPPEYVEKKILPKDPFESIDQEGVGQLVRLDTNAAGARTKS